MKIFGIGFVALFSFLLLVALIPLLFRQILILRRVIEKIKPIEVEGQIISVQQSGGDIDTVELTYSYEFNGKNYRSDTIFEAGNVFSKDYLEVDLRNDIKSVGNKVAVYVDPKAPKHSWLVPEKKKRKSLMSLIVIAFIGYVLYILVSVLVTEIPKI